MGRPAKHPIVGGQRFGNRVVLREVPKTASNVHRRVEVQCDCGDIGQTQFFDLLRGICTACASCSSRVEFRSPAATANIEQRRKERRATIQALRDRGMTLREIADQLGYSSTGYLSLVLSGKR